MRFLFQAIFLFSILILTNYSQAERGASIGNRTGAARVEQNRPYRENLHREHANKDLRLTESQRRRLHEIIEEDRREAASRGEMRGPGAMRERLQRLNQLSREGASEAEIDRELNQIRDGMRRRGERREAVREVLTPEQQARFKEQRIQNMRREAQARGERRVDARVERRTNNARN